MEAQKVYVLTYEEVQIASFRIFSDFNTALKEYLKYCIAEIHDILDDSDDTSSDDSDKGEVICVLEVQTLEDKEYTSTKQYDLEHFQLLLEDKDDMKGFIADLEKELDDDHLPDSVLEFFSDE